MEQSDYNLFFKEVGGAYNLDDHTEPGGRPLPLDEWRRWGYDQHSVIADPLFADPEHDDYRLKPESPAFKLGFQAIDVEQIGIRDAGSDSVFVLN